LSLFHSLIAFSPVDPLNPDSPGELWLTHPFLSPCFSSAVVENLLNFHLCALPKRLCVTAVSPNVFKTQFASPNVARYVAVWGSWQMHGFWFCFHSSVEAAMAAAEKIQKRSPLPVRVRMLCVSQ
jgi:hypothetical protein